MKKILALLGSLTLVGSSAVTVVACTKDTENFNQDNSKYDNSEPVKEITTNAVSRLKSVILADQFKLDDSLHWAQITSYNPKNKFSENFNPDSIKLADKNGVDLSGTGGQSNVLLKELLGGLLNSLKIGDIDLGKEIIDRTGIDFDEILEKGGDLIAKVPEFIGQAPLQTLVQQLGVVLELLPALLGPMIGSAVDVPILNTIAESLPGIISSYLKNTEITTLIDSVIEVSQVKTYENFTFKEISTSLWMSLLTTISYAVDANYVTNPDLTKELDSKDNKNVKHMFDKFYNSVFKKEKNVPTTDEKVEHLGVVKYAVSTIKLLEIYLQFHGDTFFTYVPDLNDWSADKGNEHLFSKDKTNSEYFGELADKKVADTGAKDGLNLQFFFKVLKTFLANDDDKVNGMMFQKFFNALLTSYDNGSDDVKIPLWHQIFTNILNKLIPGTILASSVRILINNLLKSLTGIFTNKSVDRGVTNTISGLANALKTVSGFEDVARYLGEFSKFLQTDSGKEFMEKPSTYFWSGDIALMIPDLINPFKKELGIEKLNLSNIIYEVSLTKLVNGIAKLIDPNTVVDLNKYGDSYTKHSIAWIIQEIDKDIKIDTVTYADINNENLDLTIINELLDILLKDNPMKDPEKDLLKNPLNDNNALLRQLISNINNTENPEFISYIFGLQLHDVGQGDSTNQYYEVAEESFFGKVLKLIYPNIKADDTPKADGHKYYSYETLTNTTGFNGNLLKASSKLISSLLEGKDYTFLIKPLVSNNNIWKVLNVENTYFENTKTPGVLLTQKITVEFDPTGIKLDDGTIVDGTHRAIYEVTVRRTSNQEKFSFSKIAKKR